MNLVLYYFNGCPYCQKVLAFLKQKNLDIPLRNIMKDEGAREELLKTGGNTQVPCLFIDGKPLYESGDIIHWINQKY